MPDPPLGGPISRRIGRLALFTFLIWAVTASVAALRQVWREQDRPRRNTPLVSRWLPGSVQALSLEATLDAADRIAPTGEPLAFQPSTDRAAGPALFEMLWASYLLPARDIVPAEHPADLPAGTARFLISFHSAPDPVHYRLVARFADGALWVRR
jgi:hypothetical protein